MVDRYRIWPEGFAAHMRPAKAVDMVFAGEHDARITELEAEVERLRQSASDADIVAKHFQSERDHLQECLEDVLEQMALSRTGAVKVPAEASKEMIEGGVLAYNLTGIAGGIINTAEDHVTFIWNAMAAHLSALEPAASEPIAKGLLSDDEAKAAGLGKFGHHPDPAIDFEIEVESLHARLIDAKGGISKPGTDPETVVAALEDIERAMTFRVGGDPSAVRAKQMIRDLEADAKQAVQPAAPEGQQEAVAWQHIPNCGVDRESKMVHVTGKVFCDPCIAPLVAALNAASIETVASCCGHGHRPGVIVLRDGRELFIAKDFEEARKVDAAFPTDINGDARPSEQAVTEVLSRIRDYADKPHADRYVIRNMAEDALKAAMEAGRHD